MELKKWLEKTGIDVVEADGVSCWYGEMDINASSLGMTATDEGDWYDLWSMIGKTPPVDFPQGAQAILHTAENRGDKRQAFEISGMEFDKPLLSVHIYPVIHDEPKKGDPYVVMLYPADVAVAQHFESARKYEPPPPEPEPSFADSRTLKNLRHRAMLRPKL